MPDGMTVGYDEDGIPLDSQGNPRPWSSTKFVKIQQVDTTTLSSDNPFESMLIEMVKTHRKKSADYGADNDPYDNFVESSNQIEDVPGKSVEVLIATKQSRLKHLLFKKNKKPANEAIEDTLLDRAVYSVIAMVLYARGDYEEA